MSSKPKNERNDQSFSQVITLHKDIVQMSNNMNVKKQKMTSPKSNDEIKKQDPIKKR